MCHSIGSTESSRAEDLEEVPRPMHSLAKLLKEAIVFAHASSPVVVAG